MPMRMFVLKNVFSCLWCLRSHSQKTRFLQPVDLHSDNQWPDGGKNDDDDDDKNNWLIRSSTSCCDDLLCRRRVKALFCENLLDDDNSNNERKSSSSEMPRNVAVWGKAIFLLHESNPWQSNLTPVQCNMRSEFETTWQRSGVHSQPFASFNRRLCKPGEVTHSPN